MGVIIGGIPSILLLLRASDIRPTPPAPAPEPSAWNASDYQSNSDYYKQLTTVHDFNQTHNLRLDRLSVPRFHPGDGKSVIYLRKQFHMPDSNGTSTTLQWVHLETNKIVQLTRPIWGKYDQQVSHLGFHRNKNISIIFSSIGSIIKQYSSSLIEDHLILIKYFN